MFVVAYQRILQLSYVDKFLNDVHLEFRDKYKNELQGGRHIMDFDFKMTFDKVLRDCEKWGERHNFIILTKQYYLIKINFASCIL